MSCQQICLCVCCLKHEILGTNETIRIKKVPRSSLLFLSDQPGLSLSPSERDRVALRLQHRKIFACDRHFELQSEESLNRLLDLAEAYEEIARLKSNDKGTYFPGQNKQS